LEQSHCFDESPDALLDPESVKSANVPNDRTVDGQAQLESRFPRAWQIPIEIRIDGVTDDANGARRNSKGDKLCLQARRQRDDSRIRRAATDETQCLHCHRATLGMVHLVDDWNADERHGKRGLDLGRVADVRLGRPGTARRVCRPPAELGSCREWSKLIAKSAIVK
jgi:hypothetical protein